MPPLSRSLLFAAVMIAAPAALAQERQQPLIQLDAGFQGVYGHGTRTFGGGVVLEPRLNINDHLAIALRTDAAIQLAVAAGSGNADVRMGIHVGELVKGEFYFAPSGVRPYVGFGAGLYVITGQAVNTGTDGAVPNVSQSAGRYFGIAPQLGVDFGPVRLAATYNAILGADIELQQSVGNPVRYSRNYLSLELSFSTWKWSPPTNASAL